MADIAGHGGERVRDVLEAVMGGIIHVVENFGGDVLRVAGDAVICVFHGGINQKVSEEELSNQCLRCAFEALSLLDSPVMTEKIGRKLVLHIGVSSGKLNAYHVGGHGDYQCVCMGDAFDEVATALVLAERGEVVCSKHTSELLAKREGVWVIEKKANEENFLTVKTREKSASSFRHLEDIPLPLDRQKEMDPWERGTCDASKNPLLKRYVPSPIVEAADIEVVGMLGELRRASVMFVSIDSDFLRQGYVQKRAQKLQQIYNILEDNVCTYRGVVKEFSVDDKGLVLVAGFGIPPHVGVSPPTRACQCSLSTRSELAEIEVVCHIGVTTGAVYAGSLGSDTRREYAMVGDTVNLASRLMSCSKLTVGKLKENSRNEAKRRAFLEEQRQMRPKSMPSRIKQQHGGNNIDPPALEGIEHRAKLNEETDETTCPPDGFDENSDTCPIDFEDDGALQEQARVSTIGKVKHMMRKVRQDILDRRNRTKSDSAEEPPPPPPPPPLPTSILKKKNTLGNNDTKDSAVSVKVKKSASIDARINLDKVDRIRAQTHLGHAPSPVVNRKSMISTYTTLSKNDTFVPKILIDEHTAKEVSNNHRLFVYGLPPIHVKGKTNLVPIHLLFSTKGDDKDPLRSNRHNSTPEHATYDALDRTPTMKKSFKKRPTLPPPGGQRSAPVFFKDNSHTNKIDSRDDDDDVNDTQTRQIRSITESLFGLHSPPDSPISPAMQIAKMSLTASHHNDEILSFSKFRMLLPMVLGGTGVTRQVEDIVWVRTIGVPQYIRTFADELEGADKVLVDENGDLTFGPVDLSFILEVASTVPNKVQRSITNLVGRLDSTSLIVLKVISVAGGGCSFKMLNHLMNNVAPFCTFWKSVKTKRFSEFPGSSPPKRAPESPPRRFAPPVFDLEDTHNSDGKDDSGKVPPITTETQGKNRDDIISKNLLVEALRELQERQFLRYDDDLDVVIVSDVFMIDTVYGMMPFKQRKELHTAIALWHKKETGDDLGERMKRFPIIVHHYVMAQKEDRASAELIMLTRLGGTFIDNWIKTQISLFLPR